MKKLYLILAAVVMAAAIIISVVCVSMAGGESAVVGRIPDSGEAVILFLHEMKVGEYEKAMQRVDNYDSLGFEKEGSELIELYKATLRECYDFRLMEQPEQAQQLGRLEDIQRIELTFLDGRLLMSAVSELTAEKAYEYMNDGFLIENDEQAMSFVYEALRECLATPEEYCSTEYFDIAMEYDGERWTLTLGESLVDAMFGYIDSLTATAEEIA